MTKELNNLLSLLFQDGRVKIENGSLLVPPEIARRFGHQIRKFKPEILLALGHCPVCARELVVRIEDRERLSTGKKEAWRHSWCSMPGHFDEWEF